MTPQTKVFNNKVYYRQHYSHILRYIRVWERYYSEHGFGTVILKKLPESAIKYELYIRSGNNPTDPGPLPIRISLGRCQMVVPIVYEGML
jgi:hypothetical protein